MLAALSVCLWGTIVLVRLLQLQVFGRDGFLRQAARQSERTVNLDPRRGPILDRNGSSLAVSVDAESIYAVPQEIEEPEKTAAQLSRALGLDAAARKELAAQLHRNKAFVWVKRKVDPQMARAVRDLQLEGIGFLAENRRYYPKRASASAECRVCAICAQPDCPPRKARESRVSHRGARSGAWRAPRARRRGKLSRQRCSPTQTEIAANQERHDHVCKALRTRLKSPRPANRGGGV